MRKHRNTEKNSLQTLLYDDHFTQGVKITAVNTKWQLSFHFFVFFTAHRVLAKLSAGLLKMIVGQHHNVTSTRLSCSIKERENHKDKCLSCFFSAPSETIWPLWENQPQRRSFNWVSAPTQQTSPFNRLSAGPRGAFYGLLLCSLQRTGSFLNFQSSPLQLNIGESCRVAAKHTRRSLCFSARCERTYGRVAASVACGPTGRSVLGWRMS